MQIIILDATTKKLQAVLAGAVSANQPQYTVHYADSDSTSLTEGSSSGVLNSATDVDILAAPATGVKRVVKDISIYNADTAAVTLSVKFYDNTNVRTIWKGSLPSGETWTLADFNRTFTGVVANAAITGATKTKITYDYKGLVTSGADATTADIADSTNKRYVTDAQLTVIGNTSGTNTGDQNIFKTIAVAGQSDVIADSTADTLNLVAGTNISITTDASTDSVTITSTGGGVSPSAVTELKISNSSKGGVHNGDFEYGTGSYNTAATFGWVGSENYGWGTFINTGSTGTVSYDTTARTGSQAIKLALGSTTISHGIEVGQEPTIGTSTPSAIQCGRYLIPVKGSTTYRLSFWAKGNNLATDQGQYVVQTYSATAVRNLNVATNITPSEYQLYTYIFTTGATDTFLQIGFRNGYTGFTPQAGDLWIDSVNVQEIATDTTYTGTLSEVVRPVFTADNTITSIDQYALDESGFTAVYGVNWRGQSFTPTKKHQCKVAFKILKEGTIATDLILEVNAVDGSNKPTTTVVAKKALPASSFTSSYVEYTYDLSAVLTIGNVYALKFYTSGGDATNRYRIRASTSPTSSYAGGTLWNSGNSGSTWTDATQDLYFKTYYTKRTESFSVTANGKRTLLKPTTGDGVLTSGILDCDNGKFKYSNAFNSAQLLTDIYSASAGGSAVDSVINNWGWTDTNETLTSASDTTARDIVIEVNTLLPIKHLKITPTLFNNNVALGTVSVSTDNSVYSTVWTLGASASAQTRAIETDFANGSSVVYIKIAKDTTNGYIRIDNLAVEADVNTTALQLPIVYPLAVNSFSEVVSMPSVVTRVYFRKAKFLNEFGIITPAIEFTDGSDNHIGYTCLKLDNSQEANPCVNLLTGTTNWQQSGTGSNDSTTGYILNDGEYMTLSTAVAEIALYYKVGTGTTTFGNITKNTFYLASGSDNSDNGRDGSAQQKVVLGIRQQGIIEKTNDVADEIESLKTALSGVIMQDWTPATTGWVYTSADSPIFVVSVRGDASRTISNGMRIRLMQGSTVKYFIVVGVGAYTAGSTAVTLYGGTDYTLTNEVISSVCYSSAKTPFGFNADKTKWTVTSIISTNISQATPTNGTWYNIGSTTLVIPIGKWVTSFAGNYGLTFGTGGSNCYIALSTSASSPSNERLKTAHYFGSGVTFYLNAYKYDTLDIASKTTYYLICKADSSGVTSIGIVGGVYGYFIIEAVCAYI